MVSAPTSGPISASLKQRLRDPAYLELHMAAVVAMRDMAQIRWYDGYFLTFYETARLFLARVRPDQLERFENAFAPLRTPRDFAVREIEGVFAPEILTQVRQEVAALSASELEPHELETFGRHVVHDHPFFLQLQKQLTARVSDLLGSEVEPGYNFLSLYGNSGRCGLHMDQPLCMYTLDVCVDQNVEWPIWFSDAVDWPDAAAVRAFDSEQLRRSLTFRDYVLQPNNAILFSGSGQWHYRDAMPHPGFCNLLFFHYFPKGCFALTEASKWPQLFGIAELEPLIALLTEVYPHAMGFTPAFAAAEMQD